MPAACTLVTAVDRSNYSRISASSALTFRSESLRTEAAGPYISNKPCDLQSKVAANFYQ